MNENICHSGGALGADTAFGNAAEKAGHKVIHFSFEGHRKGIKNAFVLNINHLLGADQYLIEANKFLKRRFPTRRPEIDNLLRRNYYQIEDSERVYAVCPLEENGYPKGGTAWAVTMAILKGIKQIYLFEEYTQKWLKLSKFKGEKIFWKQAIPPVPLGKYTGIGSRHLTREGEQAIQQLFERSSHSGELSRSSKMEKKDETKQSRVLCQSKRPRRR